MPNFTPNLNLEKPLKNEFYNVDIFNSNSDKIDAAVENISTNSYQKPTGGIPLSDVSSQITDRLDWYGTTTGTENLVLNIPEFVGPLKAGTTLRFRAGSNSTGSINLNFNGNGNKRINRSNGSQLNRVDAGGIYTIVYDGSNFILQGEGGVYSPGEEIPIDKLITGSDKIFTLPVKAALGSSTFYTLTKDPLHYYPNENFITALASNTSLKKRDATTNTSLASFNCSNVCYFLEMDPATGETYIDYIGNGTSLAKLNKNLASQWNISSLSVYNGIVATAVIPNGGGIVIFDGVAANASAGKAWKYTSDGSLQWTVASGIPGIPSAACGLEDGSSVVASYYNTTGSQFNVYITKISPTGSITTYTLFTATSNANTIRNMTYNPNNDTIVVLFEGGVINVRSYATPTYLIATLTINKSYNVKVDKEGFIYINYVDSSTNTIAGIYKLTNTLSKVWEHRQGLAVSLVGLSVNSLPDTDFPDIFVSGTNRAVNRYKQTYGINE